jgi:hypothetical protein
MKKKIKMPSDKQNPDAPRRTSVILPFSLLLKLRTRAFEQNKTLTKYLSELLTKATKE